MISSLNDDVVMEMRRHIKIFLTYFEKMDQGMRHEKESSWISCYNFVFLLNIPDQVNEFGPVHDYWEGGGLGEKFIQVAKKNLHFHGNWHCNVINKIIIYHTINLLNEHENHFHDADNNNNQKNLYMRVHTYRCSAIPKNVLLNNKSIAFVELHDRQFYIKISTLWIRLKISSYYGEKGGHHFSLGH